VAGRSGGIFGLVAFLDQRWDALEADFQAIYGLDLRTVVWGDHAYGFRRLTALIRGLGPSARVWEPEHGRWGPVEHLLASNLEVTHAVYRAVLASIPQPKHQRRPLPPPFLVQRPGVQHKERRRRISPLEFMRMVKSG
jgi:hypothetical protein